MENMEDDYRARLFLSSTTMTTWASMTKSSTSFLLKEEPKLRGDSNKKRDSEPTCKAGDQMLSMITKTTRRMSLLRSRSDRRDSE